MLSPSLRRSGGVIDFIQTVYTRLSSRHEFQISTVGGDDSALPMPFRIVRDGLSLIWTVVSKRPDLVHLNPSLDRAIIRDGLYLILIRLVHRGPIVVFIHGWDARWAGRINSSRLLAMLFRAVFGGADRIYVLATKFCDQLTDWGIEKARLRITSTMFDATLFRGLTRQRAKPSGPDELQILFMSRLVEAKGACETVRAFAAVSESVSGLRLVCAGDGPERGPLERWTNEHGLSNRVAFPGFVRGIDKAQLLLDSDLFVFPTRHGEGCPVSLLEAMAAGLPIITAEAGGIADVFCDGVNGTLLSAQPDHVAVAGALTTMISDMVKMQQIGEANSRAAYTRFEADNWCRMLEADYTTLKSRSKSLHS